MVEEEGNLGRAERDLEEAAEAHRVCREEDEKREKARREEAQRAREPRCMDLDESEGDVELVEGEEEEDVAQEGGKKRKVVRRVRSSRVDALLRENDINALRNFLMNLSRENKLACMRCLEEDGGAGEVGGGLNPEVACQGLGGQEDPNLTPCG